MLILHILESESYDHVKEEFITVKPTKLVLEHSLVSLAKWEAKWHVPFLKPNDDKTPEQVLDYIRCMTITQNVDPNVYYTLTPEQIDEVNRYIDNPMTATTFGKSEQSSGSRRNSVYTAEIVYYWMITLNIPFECQKWHLNRLLTLIQVINIKNQPAKKRSRRDQADMNRRLNEERRRQYGTRG